MWYVIFRKTQSAIRIGSHWELESVVNNNRSIDSRSQEPHARRDACVENRKSEPATGANDRAGLIVAVSSECERTTNLVKQMDRAGL